MALGNEAKTLVCNLTQIWSRSGCVAYVSTRAENGVRELERQSHKNDFGGVAAKLDLDVWRTQNRPHAQNRDAVGARSRTISHASV